MNELQPRSFAPQAAGSLPDEPAATAHDLALVAWRRLWLIVLIVAVSTLTAAFLSRRTPPAWRASAQVLLEQRNPVLAASAQDADNAPMVESIDTQITLLQSRQLAQEAAQKVGITAETLQGASAITPRKDGDNVIDVTVEAGSRQEAVAWAKALCETFIEYKTALAQDSSRQDLNRLSIQASQAQKQAAADDQALLRFQEQHHLNGIGVLDPQQQKTAALNAVLAQQAIIAGLRNDNIAAQANAANLHQQLARTKAVIAASHTVRDDSAVRTLQAQLGQLQQKREQVAKLDKPIPGSPGGFALSQIDSQIALAQAQLNAAFQASQSQPSLEAEGTLQQAATDADTTARSAQIKLNAAIAEGARLQQQTVDLPRISLEAQNLIDADNEARKLSDAASTAVQAAQLAQATASGNVQIVQPAYAPEAPFRPQPKRDMAVGFGIGLVLALLAVLLLEQIDRSVRTAADVRRLVDGPVVAVLPQMSRAERSRFASGDQPPHLIEAYNAARANLGIAMRQRTGTSLDDHQVILVTSALPGEGKSLTSSELARSYARAGRRVVLVNADMRRPSVFMPAVQASERASAPGLAEVLAGDARVEDALMPTETANLSLLHGGNAGHNPVDLISQPRLAETLQHLREAADVVIVDSPPAAVVADALLIAPHVDCILYVVGIGIVDSESMRNTTAALAAAAPKMLAYFVNRVPRLLGEPSSYSYTGYGRTTFAPTPASINGAGTSGAGANGAGRYQSTQTVVLERQIPADLGGVSSSGGPIPPHFAGPVIDGNGSSGASGISAANGTHPVLRVVPRAGSSLTSLDGPYAGQSFLLSASKSLTLGARPDCDIALARDETISQVHAHIAPEDGQFVIYDVSSTNGTLVNGQPVSRHVLEVGDVLEFGASKFRYE